MTQQSISRTPKVPHLTDEEWQLVERVTFLEKATPKKCDAIFLFSSTHELHWEKAVEAYQEGYADKIIITGGRSKTSSAHESWKHGQRSEASVIVDYLLKSGIPTQAIVAKEERSSNSLENVLFALDIFDFSQVKSLLLVCKSHVVGRQSRTLANYIPERIELVPYTYDAVYKGVRVGLDNWRDSKEAKARVWGEYLRIVHYGFKGDLKPLEELEVLANSLIE